MAQRFLSNIKINDAYTLPASDGSNGQVIVTDGSGNLGFADPSTSSSASVIYRDNFTGDGSTVAFTLQNSLSDEDQTFIYIDGVYQEKDNYSLNTDVITFTTAPESGHSVEVISISGINVGPTTIYQDNFTGDGVETEFNMAQSVDNEVKTMIYFNGVYQFKGTYTVNGTLITFDTAPSNGVNIEVISIASAAAADYNQKMLFYGKASEAISKGDAIMLGGQQGDHFLLAKATQSAIAANHEYFLGLASQDLAQGEFGYVTEFGKIIEIDTSGYTAGDILWFDAGGSTAGALTTTEPAAPLAKIQVAAVIRSHQNEGVLFVRPTWYHELGELHDVNITSVADKDLLVWNDTAGYWENSKTVDTLTGNTLSATTLTGTLSTAAQTNITSVGTLSSLAVDGAISLQDTSIPSAGTARIFSRDTNSYLYLQTGSGNQIQLLDGSQNTLALFNPSLVSFSISNSERMRIDSSGNVGIGTTSPVGKLNVALPADSNGNVGAWSSNQVVFTRGGTSTSQGLGFSVHDVDNTATISSLTPAVTWSNLDFRAQAYTFYSNGATLGLSQDIAGNVGIGTTSPLSRLHVSGDGTYAGGITLRQGTNQAHYIYTSSQFQLNRIGSSAATWRWGQEGGSDFMTLNPTGLGIGTTSPAMGLHVNQYKGFLVGNTTNWDSTYISPQNENTINTGYGYDSDNADLWVNYRGYQDGQTRFRNFKVGDGKGSSFASFIGSTGNVGIGTTSPSAKLNVVGGVTVDANGIGNTVHVWDDSASGQPGFIVTNTGTQATSSHTLYLKNYGDDINSNVFGTAIASKSIVASADGGSGLLFGTISNAPIYVGTNDALAMVVDTSQRVGIGTSSPDYKLDIEGGSATGFRSYSDGFACVDIESARTSGNIGGVRWETAGDSHKTAEINAIVNGGLAFRTGTGSSAISTKMYITETGDVGIGTDSPDEILHIRDTNEPTLRIESGDTSGASGEVIGKVDFWGNDFSGTGRDSRGYIASVYEDAFARASLTFGTGDYNATSSERMRIYSNGDIVFCKTTTSVDVNGVYIQAGSDGAIYSSVGSPVNTYHVYNTLNNRYDFYVTYNGTIYARNATVQSLSDERLKENIQDLTGSLDTVTSLRPRVFDFKDGSKLNSKGFVAQEVEQVLPECVKEFTAGDPLEDGTRYKTVGQDFMPYIVGAIKELKEIIDNQQQEINDLKQRILTLENNNNG